MAFNALLRPMRTSARVATTSANQTLRCLASFTPSRGVAPGGLADPALSDKAMANLTEILVENTETSAQAPRTPAGLTRENHLVALQGFTSPHMYSHKFATRTIQKGRAPKLGPGAREARRHDVFAQLDIDPLREVGNRRLLSRFVSEMGKIKPRQETKLSRKSQHRLGKAIRRSKMMGLIPVLRKPMWSKNYFEF